MPRIFSKKFPKVKLINLGKPVAKKRQKSKVLASASGVMGKLPEFEKVMKEIYEASKNSNHLEHEYAKELIQLQDSLWQKAVIEKKTKKEIAGELGFSEGSVRNYLYFFGIPSTSKIERLKERWEDPKFREKQKKALQKVWQDEEFRKRHKQGLEIKWSDEEFRKKMSDKTKEQMKDSEFKQKVHNGAKEKWKDPEYRKMQSEKTKKQWEDPKFRESSIQSVLANWENPKFREMMSEKMKKQMEDPEFREKQRQAMEKLWEDPEFRQMQSDKFKKQWEDPEFKKLVSEVAKMRMADPEYKQKVINGVKTNWKNPMYKQMMIDKIKVQWEDEEFRLKQKQAVDKLWQDQEFRLKMLNKWNDPNYFRKMTVESSKLKKEQFKSLPLELRSELSDIYTLMKTNKLSKQEASEFMLDWWAKVESINPIEKIPYKATRKRVEKKKKN